MDENEIMHTFAKVKLGCKNRPETALKSVQQCGSSLPSPKGFLPSNAEWHTSQGMEKLNHQAAKKSNNLE